MSGNAPIKIAAEGERSNSRGHKLLTVHYAADAAEGIAPSAVLIWHHGYGEHVGRYKWVFSQFSAAGIAVHSFDAHGHGRSEPSRPDDRCLVQNYIDLVDDLDEYVCEVKELYPKGIPLFLGGQSMGGLITLLEALRVQKSLSGVVLTSAAVNVEWTPALKAQAKVGTVLAALFPRARIVPAVRPEDMSPDQDVVKDYISDPLNFVGKIRIRTGNELLKGFKQLELRERELEVPILALHGTADRCTSIAAVKRLLKNSTSSDATLNEIQGGFHEMLKGPEKVEVLECIVKWILAHSNASVEATAATPSA